MSVCPSIHMSVSAENGELLCLLIHSGCIYLPARASLQSIQHNILSNDPFLIHAKVSFESSITGTRAICDQLSSGRSISAMKQWSAFWATQQKNPQIYAIFLLVGLHDKWSKKMMKLEEFFAMFFFHFWIRKWMNELTKFMKIKSEIHSESSLFIVTSCRGIWS